MSDDPDDLSRAAVGLSSAAILASLIKTLNEKNLLSDDEENAVYDAAIALLGDNAGEDEDGVFELAQEIIEERWKPAPG
ncbi:hypothetical protein SB748_15060 [Rhizobium sp. SIMBA_035]|jgi:hypothetical protein|uniref:hypothetical protein n=1 Tax=Rhizobium sp. RAF36 TaxID=3233055 RepID=UPI000DD57C83